MKLLLLETVGNKSLVIMLCRFYIVEIFHVLVYLRKLALALYTNTGKKILTNSSIDIILWSRIKD